LAGQAGAIVCARQTFETQRAREVTGATLLANLNVAIRFARPSCGGRATDASRSELANTARITGTGFADPGVFRAFSCETQQASHTLIVVLAGRSCFEPSGASARAFACGAERVAATIRADRTRAASGHLAFDGLLAGHGQTLTIELAAEGGGVFVTFCERFLVQLHAAAAHGLVERREVDLRECLREQRVAGLTADVSPELLLTQAIAQRAARCFAET
jgi:hypothetical protein